MCGEIIMPYFAAAIFYVYVNKSSLYIVKSDVFCHSDMVLPLFQTAFLEIFGEIPTSPNKSNKQKVMTYPPKPIICLY